MARLVGSIVESATPLIAEDVPEKVVLVASQLLLSLASTVRPKFLISFACVQRLMEKATSGQLVNLPVRVRRGGTMEGEGLKLCVCVEVWG